jgi:hypothetical protein
VENFWQLAVMTLNELLFCQCLLKLVSQISFIRYHLLKRTSSFCILKLKLKLFNVLRVVQKLHHTNRWGRGSALVLTQGINLLQKGGRGLTIIQNCVQSFKWLLANYSQIHKHILKPEVLLRFNSLNIETFTFLVAIIFLLSPISQPDTIIQIGIL